jgi:SAM-dependent methyltransferase
MTEDRVRERQGPVRIVRGVPYANRETTLSLLPGAAIGRWLSKRSDDVRGVLLDLGAGNQPFRPWYESLADRVVAIDVAPVDGLSVLGMAPALPFRDGSFDTVLCTSVLEHVENAEAGVSELVRVLRPGGRLLITVPFLYPTHEAPYDYWRTTHYGLTSVLERHGFIIDDLSAQGGPFLLLIHFVVLVLVQLRKAARTRLGWMGRLIDNGATNALLAAPQELVRSSVRCRLSPLSRAASMGYMAAAHVR